MLHTDNSYLFNLIFWTLILYIGGFLFFKTLRPLAFLIEHKLPGIFSSHTYFSSQLAAKLPVSSIAFSKVRLYVLSAAQRCIFILRILRRELPGVLYKYYLPFMLLLLSFLGVSSFYVLLAGGSKFLLLFSAENLEGPVRGFFEFAGILFVGLAVCLLRFTSLWGRIGGLGKIAMCSTATFALYIYSAKLWSIYSHAQRWNIIERNEIKTTITGGKNWTVKAILSEQERLDAVTKYIECNWPSLPRNVYNKLCEKLPHYADLLMQNDAGCMRAVVDDVAVWSTLQKASQNSSWRGWFWDLSVTSKDSIILMAQISHNFYQNHSTIVHFAAGVLIFAAGLYLGGRGSCDGSAQLEALTAQVKQLQLDHANTATEHAETLYLIGRALPSLVSAVDLLSKAALGVVVSGRVNVPSASWRCWELVGQFLADVTQVFGR